MLKVIINGYNSSEFLKKCLQNCISDENTVEKIMIYIKENREFRYTKDIRRTYSNNT